MNPHAEQPSSPLALVESLWKNRNLINQMVKRDVIGRYKGSMVGLGWSFFNPILMLTIYTFVFSFVFKARWGVDPGEGKGEFAIVLFVGLIIHSLFAEVINRAPGVIPANVNYVKKVIFPLDVLPVVAMGSALFHALVSVSVLLLAVVLLKGGINWTVILFPFVIMPFIVITLGFAWMLASIGVYVRDVSQAIGMITTMMLFLSPVFYPISAIPEKYQIFLYLNPLTYIIEQSREVLIFGHIPNLSGLLLYTGISIFTAWIGFWWFQGMRKGFADVL